VEPSGRRFITSFPMPSAAVRAPMGLAASTRNSAFDVDRGSVEEAHKQGAPESTFFLLSAFTLAQLAAVGEGQAFNTAWLDSLFHPPSLVWLLFASVSVCAGAPPSLAISVPPLVP
jgi:hypothetical protein